MELWSGQEVIQWLTSIGCGQEVCKTFTELDIDGIVLRHLSKEDLVELGPSINFGNRKRILVHRDKYVKAEQSSQTNLSAAATAQDSTDEILQEELRPFDSPSSMTLKYKATSTVPILETRPEDLTTAIHKFVDIQKVTKGNEAIPAICRQTVLFACACLNDHTNGTIHFGIKDQKIIGLELTVDQRMMIKRRLTIALRGSFDLDQIENVLGCVRPPKFIEVQPCTAARSKRYVIEVDVRPVSELCGKDIFYAKPPNLQLKGQKFEFGEPAVFR